MALPTVAGYQLLDQLYTGHYFQVYRAQRTADQLPVILKILIDPVPPPARLAWFQREYDLLASLDLPGVIRAYMLDQQQSYWTLVMEDIGGESLNLLRQRHPFAQAELLRIAINIADCLAQIQQHHVIHKDITPANIVYNPETGQVKLIDFGISSRLSRERPTFRNPLILEGTLSYMSPEQTGRTNREIDYRTDFYGLGATLYELLTGHVPFPTHDPLELVHCHLAKAPVPPSDVDRTIPPSISAIVMKLLAKDPDRRYQSAYGLKADLEQALELLEGRSEADQALFVPGSADISDHFHLPQRLYGREAEIATLLTTFEQARSGQSALLLVVGEAGIGKSTLVQELYAPITHKRGSFAVGKFDQFQQSSPYVALIQALRSLLRHLLTEDDAHLAVWRRSLLKALGSNGQIICDVLPELELIIGTQPPVPALGPIEAQNRFQLVFQDVIGALAQPDHPLVLFIDDLQWADHASLSLIERLLTSLEGSALLLIGAYRDNEIQPGHPVVATQSALEHGGVAVHRIALAPLTLADITRLLVDTLHAPPEQVTDLALLLQSKTEGNPFFVGEFLTSMYREGLITFDYALGRWQWNMADIARQQITGNVVSLLVQRIERLTPEAQGLLTLAACLGNQVNLSTLALVAQQSSVHTARVLDEVLQERLLTPMGDTYKLVTFEAGESLQAEYRFAHDRVQQAVYSQLSGEESAALHQRIGRLLLERLPADQREECRFEIVNHLNKGAGARAAMTEEERLDLAHLNLQAASRARAAAAYEPALGYARAGIELIGSDGWQQSYTVMLLLHLEAIQAAYLSGEPDFAERIIPQVLDEVQTPLHTLQVYTAQIQSLVLQNKLLETLSVAREVLMAVGIIFPEKPDRSDFMRGFQATMALMANTSIDDLRELPLMGDALALETMNLLSMMTSAAFIAMPAMFPLVVFEQLKLLLTYGNTTVAPFTYACYAMILHGLVGKVAEGEAFADLALEMLDRLDARDIKARTLFAAYLFIKPWSEDLRTIKQVMAQIYHIGQETGDLEFSNRAGYQLGLYGLIIGQELPTLAEEVAIFREHMVRLNQQAMLHRIGMVQQTIENLRRPVPAPWKLSGELYDQDVLLPLMQQNNELSSVYYTSFYLAMLGCIFGRYDEVRLHVARAEQAQAGAVGVINTGFMPLFDALSLLGLYPDQTPEEQEQSLARVAALQEKLAGWAIRAPMTFNLLWEFLEAERSRVLGDEGRARISYDRAIALAHDDGNHFFAGLTNEHAARFYEALGHTRLADFYAREAHRAYGRWGAAGKVAALEQRYPFLSTRLASSQGQNATTTKSTQEFATTLDLTSVLKASQAITGEIVLETLLSKLLYTVIENAGAERGVLILEHDGHWLIEAEGLANGTEIKVLQALALEQGRLPHTIINYVAHTHQLVVLDDAPHAGDWTQDSYIAEEKPCSVLCLPLSHQGHLTGMLYLENRQTPSAFTVQRIELINLLSGQMAIAIENAHLYAELEERVIARTAELNNAYQTVKTLNSQLQRELTLARQIQESLLPPPPTSWQNIDVLGYTTPAREVGGDLYAYHMLEPDRFVIAVGDISGKGMPAALLMAVSTAILRSLVLQRHSPSALLEHMNTALRDYTRTTRQNCALVCAEVCKIDHGAGFMLRIANAGCISPLIRRRDGSLEWLEVNGLPLGGELSSPGGYQELRLDLLPGDQVLLLSDGIVESMNEHGELFGFERMEETVRGAPQGDLGALKAHIQAELAAFVGAVEPHDDITLVALHVKR